MNKTYRCSTQELYEWVKMLHDWLAEILIANTPYWVYSQGWKLGYFSFAISITWLFSENLAMERCQVSVLVWFNGGWKIGSSFGFAYDRPRLFSLSFGLSFIQESYFTLNAICLSVFFLGVFALLKWCVTAQIAEWVEQLLLELLAQVWFRLGSSQRLKIGIHSYSNWRPALKGWCQFL